MRLAWFSPWSPQHSGVAGRSTDLVPRLAARGYGVDVFVDEQDPDIAPIVARGDPHPPQPGVVRVQTAHDFVWRVARGQYDLPVYQIGNSRLHEFVWPYLVRWPGLVVLHDARLHHARGRALLRLERFDDYRAEFAWNHPGVSPDAAELGVKGFDGLYYYQWPMVRSVVESARLVASHSRGAVDILRDTFPHCPVEYIALGEGPDRFDVVAARRQFRATYQIDPDAIVFGVYGALTPDKRVPQIVQAFAATRARAPGAMLVLAGTVDARLDLHRRIAALGLADAVRYVEPRTDQAFDTAIAAGDVSLNLRWPTALETSGPWVRSLALGRATVIVDLAHQGHVPALDPRTWRRHAPCEDPSSGADAGAVTVAVDILDEDHSLRLAMRRLAVDQELRDRLGREGRRFWEREHTVERMEGDYVRAIARALDRPLPTPNLPAHLRPDPLEAAKRLLAPFGDLDLFRVAGPPRP